MLKEILERVYAKAPLIHNITNYVTANDCANIILACGAAPVMADDQAEVEAITESTDSLVINIGTLNQHIVPAMMTAGKRAAALGHPIVFDPAGAGASPYRTKTAQSFLRLFPITVIRGNRSEINALSGGKSNTKGVDADKADIVTEENLDQAIADAKSFARQTGSIVSISGAVDIVADQSAAYCVRNGHPYMRLITGSGCMLSAVTAVYLAANPSEPLTAALAAVCAMGIAGEKAAKRMKDKDGLGSFRVYLTDAVSRLTPEDLERLADYEMR